MSTGGQHGTAWGMPAHTGCSDPTWIPLGSCSDPTRIPLGFHSDPAQIPLRFCSDLAQIPLGFHSDPTQILPRSWSDPTRIPLRSCSDPTRTLLRSCSDPARILLRPFSNPTQILLRSHCDPAQILRCFSWHIPPRSVPEQSSGDPTRAGSAELEHKRVRSSSHQPLRPSPRGQSAVRLQERHLSSNAGAIPRPPRL